MYGRSKRNFYWLNGSIRSIVVLMMILTTFLPMGAVRASGLPASSAADTPASVQATLLDENFDYGVAVGDLTTVSGDVWAAHSGGTTNPIQYATTSLVMPSYVSSGVGGSATFSGSGQDVNRTFASQTSGTLYYAALVNLTSATSGGTYFMHFKDTSTGFAGRLFARDDNGNLQFGVGTTSTGVYSTTNFAYNTTYLVVVKYNLDTGVSDLFVLDACTSTEPTTPLASAPAGTSLLSTIVAIAIRQGGSSGVPAGTVDGIRVADNWAEVATCVVPSLTIDKTGPDNLKVNEGFEYSLTVDNRVGFPLSQVVITDSLPLSATFQAATPGYELLPGNVVSWTVSSLANAATLPLTISVMAPGVSTTLINEDYVAHASEWPTPTHGAAVNTTVFPLDLAVSKAAPAVSIGGEPLEYQIQVTLNSSVTASNVQITDTLPADVAYASDTSGFVPSLSTPGLVVWSLGDVPTTTTEISFTMTVTPSESITSGLSITNQIAVSTDTPGDPQGNNTAQAQTQIYQIVPIATARAGSNGQIFAIEGQVIYLPYTFGTNEWGLQDSSGGIAVYYSPPPAVDLGDTVIMVAPRSSYSNQEQMGTPLYYINLGAGPEVLPVHYATGNVAAGLSEGWLIQIAGTVSGLSTCPAANYSFYVDDGSGPAQVYVDVDTGVNVCDMGAANGKLISVSGFSTQYSSSFELKPRSPSDIEVAAAHPAISKQAPATVGLGGVFTYTITIQNQMGLTLSNVTVTDNLPVQVTSSEGSTISRTFASLANHGQISFSFPVTATNQEIMVVNSSYYVTATEYPTLTYGSPVNTLVLSGTLQIHDIQGSGHTSPFVGQTVSDIQGVVTLLTTSGFYMQGTTPDANPDTSEGIYVYTSSGPTVQVGDDVSVSGLVSEYNGMTELGNITDLTTLGTGLTVTPTLVTLPVPVGKDLEPYESMLVTFPQILTADQNYFQGRYGQVTISAGRMYNPTNGNGLGDTVAYNLRRMIVLDDASSVQNPNPIPYIGADNTLRAGDVITGATGVVDYGPINSDTSIRFYRLQPTPTLPTFTRINERTTAPNAVGGSIRVASENVLNYFNGDGMGGGFPTSRGAASYDEFVRQRTKIITATYALNADIVGLMEIENDGDGIYSAIQDLVNGLNDVTAPGTYAFVDEPAPGTDEIKVAMIYKPAVVTPVGPAINYQITGDPVYGNVFDRPPLVQLFSVNATGETFYVIVNHFKSKGSCPTSLTDPDADYGQGCWNVKRIAQANGLLSLLTELHASSGEADALIIGDLNAYGEEDPILTLTGAGLVNELAGHVPAEQRYTYVFDGQAGYLDQALATPSLDEQLSGATIWHINADEPEVINYYLSNKPEDLYTPTPYRASDHDPVLVGLSPRPAALGISKVVDLDSGVDLGSTATYTVTVANQADVSAQGVVITDALPAGLTFGGWVLQNGASLAGEQWTWNGSITANTAVSFIFTATLNVDPTLYGNTVTNVAYFSSTNDGSGSAAAAFQVGGTPLLSIIKTVDLANTLPSPGDAITYTVTVANAGPTIAWGVNITDSLPQGVIGSDLDVTVTIPAGGHYTTVIPATLAQEFGLYGTTITNTAQYNYPGVGSDLAEAAFTVIGAPELHLTKSLELARDPVQRGDTLTYTVSVSNSGPSDAVGVHIVDELPAEVVGASVDVTVTVAAGAEYTIVIPGQVAQDAAYGANVINVASYTFLETTAQAEADFTVATAPALVVAKSVASTYAPVEPGDPITYTITITNQGESDAIDAHIVDVLPAEVIGAGLDVMVTIPGGSVYTIVVPGTVAANAGSGVRVTNTVHVYHLSGDGSASVSFTLAVRYTVYLPVILTIP